MRHPMNDLPVGLAGTETLKGRALGAASGGVHRIRGLAQIRIENDVADGETVTVNLANGTTLIFEFDTDSSVAAGNIAVDVTGDVTPANATATLSTVMQSNVPGVQMFNPTANDLYAVAAGQAFVGATLAETMAGVDNTVDAAVRENVQHGSPQVAAAARVPTATEVAVGELFVAFDFVVDGWVIRVEDGAGATVAWDGATSKFAGANLVLDNGGAVDWSATDTVHVLAWGRNVAAEDQPHFD